MNDDILKEAHQKIGEDLEIEKSDLDISEEELLLAIAARVAHLMDRDPGLLFSYLYRLDVSEKHLDVVINTPCEDPIAYSIAELILKRQKDRLLSKKKYNQGPPIEGWEW